jgi:hypothetical protein
VAVLPCAASAGHLSLVSDFVSPIRKRLQLSLSLVLPSPSFFLCRLNVLVPCLSSPSLFFFSPPPSSPPSSFSLEFLPPKRVSPNLHLESSASPGKGKADFAGSASQWSMSVTLPSCGRVSSHLRGPSPPSPYTLDGDRSTIEILNSTALTPLRRRSSSDAQNDREAPLDRATRHSEFPR